MINIYSEDEWNVRWEQPQNGEYIVDLRGLDSKKDIVQKLGSILKGKDSPDMQNDSLDALYDVMGDWFIDHWGEKKKIKILGWKSIEKLGSKLCLDIVDIINSSFIIAIRENHDKSEEIVREIDNTHIYIVMN